MTAGLFCFCLSLRARQPYLGEQVRLLLEMGPPPGTALGPADRKVDGREELKWGCTGEIDTHNYSTRQ